MRHELGGQLHCIPLNDTAHGRRENGCAGVCWQAGSTCREQARLMPHNDITRLSCKSLLCPFSCLLSPPLTHTAAPPPDLKLSACVAVQSPNPENL